METIAIFAAILFAGMLLYFMFSDPVSFLLFALLIAILIYVLIYFGFVSFDAKTHQFSITYRPTPVPSASTAQGVKPTTASFLPDLSEVFYVASNLFTYEQAPAVCKAYGAELASYSQVEEAYSNGAEWCGYGWTAGGIAIFPTQESTWRNLQLELDPAKRTACGRPGINGGYFDPSTKFGVNCYGVRPKKRAGLNTEDQAFAASVQRLKAMANKFSVYPFNKKEWSEHGSAPRIISADADIKNMGSTIPNPAPAKDGVMTVSASGIIQTVGETIDAGLAALGGFFA